MWRLIPMLTCAPPRCAQRPGQSMHTEGHRRCARKGQEVPQSNYRRGEASEAGDWEGNAMSLPDPAPNKGLQATANSVRSYLAPALRRA